MSTALLEEPISPELVLVALPEEAEAAREALPDVAEFYAWIAGVRELVEPVADAPPERNRRGTILFTAVVSLNALAPILLLILRGTIG